MRITVAICTWNRAALLRQTLEQFTRVSLPHDVEWELLVVNNNCADATDEVIASFTKSLPVRRLFEPQQGLSNARNRAVEEACGEYIIWTDDDVLVDEEWITEYCRAFEQHPDAAIFGGPIEPMFASPPPRWLEQTMTKVGGAYGACDFGAESIPLTKEIVPFGANFVIRMKEQRRCLFDPTLGVKAESIMVGEETTVMQRLLAEGASGWWVPQARIRHHVAGHELRTSYLRRYLYGRGLYIGRYMPDLGEVKVFGRPRWLWRAAVEAELKYRLHRLLSEPEVWVEDLKTASMSWGQLRGYTSRSES